MTTAELENRFVEELRRVMPATVAVEGFPDNPAVYETRAARGACLVRYQGARYGAPTAATQRRDMEMVVVVGAPSLRGKNPHQGTYALLDLVRSTLSGYITVEFDEAGEIQREHLWTPSSEGFVLEKSSVWWYQITFRSFQQ